MNHQDFKNRLREVIAKELESVLAEGAYKYGGLLDPSNFDPIDPEVHIVGYGTMTRSALRSTIASRLKGLSQTAANATTDDAPYKMYTTILNTIQDKGVLNQMIRAEIEVSEQLEEIRKKGGRRSAPIPKQM